MPDIGELPLASGRDGVVTSGMQGNSQEMGDWLQPEAQFAIGIFFCTTVTLCANATNPWGR
jgi:hypothetical protein